MPARLRGCPVSIAALASRAEPTIVIRPDLPAARWDSFVARQPAASAYHRAHWTGIIEDAFGHETGRLAAEADGEIVGVLPLVFFDSRLFGRFAVSMPFVNYGGILAASADARTSLLDAAVAETRRRGGTHLELRHTARGFPQLQARTHKVAMVVQLERTVDGQWQRLDRKLRNQVRKAEKSGVRMSEGGPELLDAFYDVFARNMRDLGTPVYSRRFFVEVLRQLGETARVFCAWKGDTPIAASIVLGHGDTMEVPWASSIRDFNPLCANVLVYWTMLRFAIDRGHTHFDFGRSTPLEGTYQFKQQWGAEPSPLVWEYWTAAGRALPDLSPKNPRYGRAIDMWQKLPVPVTRLVGPWIVRNIP
jgi:FemAB-related protein (PEP-CTERM system-associated)